MEKELYINLKKQIEYYIPEIRYVALWNNQFNRSNGTGQDGRKQAAFDYPAVFIEFHDSLFRQLSLGVQEFDFELSTHLGFKSFKTEDLEILELKEKLYWVVQRFQLDSFARLSRVNEMWDYDHDDVSVLKTQYHGYGKDFNRFVFAENVFESLTGVSATTIFVDVAHLTGGTDFSGKNDNGNNEWVEPTPPYDECA